MRERNVMRATRFALRMHIAHTAPLIPKLVRTVLNSVLRARMQCAMRNAAAAAAAGVAGVIHPNQTKPASQSSILSPTAAGRLMP